MVVVLTLVNRLYKAMSKWSLECIDLQSNVIEKVGSLTKRVKKYQNIGEMVRKHVKEYQNMAEIMARRKQNMIKMLKKVEG